MAISQTKYINIISSVGGSSQVSQRDLMGRVFTTNYLVPAGQVVEFTGSATNALASVADFFGITSAEYAFASKYFQTNIKNATQPQKISFARYANAAAPATLIGSRNASPLSQLQALTAGTLSVTINGAEKNDISVNLSSATSFADVANLITTAIASDATCTYDATNARFVLQTTATGSTQTLEYATGTVAVALGWNEGVAILSDGSDATSALDTIANSTAISNNFFSFYFLGAALTAEEITAIAEWNSTQNVRYLFSVTVTPENASEIATAVANYDGVALTLDKFASDAGFMPMSRIASIDYTQPNAALSMNYQQFAGVSASVQTDAESNSYDAMRVNYYGSTQQAGQSVSWYQPGLLMGTISDMGIYANEAWLKDSIFTNLLNMRLGLNSMPANNVGVGLCLTSIMQSVNLGLYNGTILPGKTLSSEQKAFIVQITGDTDAWQTVQSGGYYLTADLQDYVENGVQKYKVSYLLVYSKGDSINYIDGRDILI